MYLLVPAPDELEQHYNNKQPCEKATGNYGILYNIEAIVPMNIGRRVAIF